MKGEYTTLFKVSLWLFVLTTAFRFGVSALVVHYKFVRKETAPLVMKIAVCMLPENTAQEMCR